MNTQKKVKSSASEILPESGDVQSNATNVKPLPITLTITGNYAQAVRFYADVGGLSVAEYCAQALLARLECDMQDPAREDVEAFLDLEKAEVVA